MSAQYLEVSLNGVWEERNAWSIVKRPGKQQMSTPPRCMVGFRLFSRVCVGWQRRWKLRLALRELDNQRTVIDSRHFIFAVTEMGFEFHQVRRGHPWRGARGLISWHVHMVNLRQAAICSTSSMSPPYSFRIILDYVISPSSSLSFRHFSPCSPINYGR